MEQNSLNVCKTCKDSLTVNVNPDKWYEHWGSYCKTY